MGGIAEWIRSHKPHAVALAVVAVAAICFAAAACGAFSPAATEEEQGAARLTINVTADDGRDEESTPAIAHIEGSGVDFYHAISPDAEGNKGTSTVELTESEYVVSLISPLNRDGSAYEPYETSGEQHVSVGADGELSIDFVMKLIPAEDVTDEMVQDIVSQIKIAIDGVYYENYQNVSKTEQVQVGSHQEDQGWYETETHVDY